jgi:hypothetical protein
LHGVFILLETGDRRRETGVGRGDTYLPVDSEMVRSYLDIVAKPVSADTSEAPILRSVRGALKKADVREYKKYLAAKYR